MPVSSAIRAGVGPEHNLEADALIDLLRQGTEAGAFDPDDPASSGLLLYTALHGAAHPTLHHPDQDAVERLTTTAQQLARRAVRAPEDRPRGRGPA